MKTINDMKWIMTTAWGFVKNDALSLSSALKQAWKEYKALISQPAFVEVVFSTADQVALSEKNGWSDDVDAAGVVISSKSNFVCSQCSSCRDWTTHCIQGMDAGFLESDGTCFDYEKGSFGDNFSAIVGTACGIVEMSDNEMDLYL